jgi:hypothetical protein
MRDVAFTSTHTEECLRRKEEKHRARFQHLVRNTSAEQKNSTNSDPNPVLHYAGQLRIAEDIDMIRLAALKRKEAIRVMRHTNGDRYHTGRVRKFVNDYFLPGQGRLDQTPEMQQELFHLMKEALQMRGWRGDDIFNQRDGDYAQVEKNLELAGGIARCEVQDWLRMENEMWVEKHLPPGKETAQWARRMVQLQMLYAARINGTSK